MKLAWKILFGLFSVFLSAIVFCQSPSPRIAHIKKYKASIDSLHTLYYTLSKSLDEDSMRLFWSTGMGEGVGDGEYEWTNKDGSKGYGGFGVYIFSKDSTTYRIYSSGNKRHVRVTKAFYYENGMLVYGEMTVQREGPHPSTIYTVQEYYWNNKRLARITKNTFPVIEDRSLVPVSLFKEGIKYYDLYRYKPLTK